MGSDTDRGGQSLSLRGMLSMIKKFESQADLAPVGAIETRQFSLREQLSTVPTAFIFEQRRVR